MRATLLLIAALALLTAGCSGLPAGSADSAETFSSTSYQSGYGVRPNGPQSAADAQMDWGW